MNTQQAPCIVVLAGGHGARFWPVSRQKRPKQFLSLRRSVLSPPSPLRGQGPLDAHGAKGNGESLIQATVRRVRPLTSNDRIFVVTNAQHSKLAHEHVPDSVIISEPSGRNTAVSIGLAALWTKRQVGPHAVNVILPADHVVEDEANLRESLSRAVSLATDHDMLVTVGIRPTFAHTGYGYIKRGSTVSAGAFRVQRFFEKPSFERATKYVESGDFYWNSGMFAWRAEVILQAFAEHMPTLYAGLIEIEAALAGPQAEQVLERVFNTLESVSIDFGVLEHARNCAVVEAVPYGWNDIGSWDAWAEHVKPDAAHNVFDGDVVALDVENCVVHTERKSDAPMRVTALLGVRDLVVIDSGDALLVCSRERVQDVKKVVDILKKQGRQELV